MTAAARTLRYSQPTVSQQIKRLERGLRTQLFTRGRGGLELTEAGFRLLDQAPHLLAQAEVLRQALACCERDGSAADRLPGTPAPDAALLPAPAGEAPGRAGGTRP